MMLLDVLAAWLVVVGAQSRKVWPVVAAGAVLGLAFNVKLFEALIAVPAIAVLMLLAVDLPLGRRMLALGGSLVAFVVVGLAWIVTASMTPLGARPWPIGSTNGSVWNVVFGFNGVDRLRIPASPAALALDPPGPLRFVQASARHYPSLVGTMLVAAVVLGAAAAALALVRRREWSWTTHRLQIAGAAFLGVWLVSGVALLSHMQRLQPRYLEAVTPAIAGVLGVGLAGLVAAATARRPRLGATVGLAGLVAVLALPASSAITVASRHRSDAGLAMPPAPAALSNYLISHQGGARYEIASANVVRAAPLIIRDARPVLMLTSLYGRPLLNATQLQHLVATGQVRYMLGKATCGSGGCAEVLKWARAHARDVSAAASRPRGTLFRLGTSPVKAKAR
jgi:hypothetical protein